MSDIVDRTLHQTAAISKTLKRNTLPETLDAVWTFLYKHVQYKLDRPDVEELREPARSWADRATGIDCDCFSIFVSSILSNLGIKHKFRITKYGAGWQHVYVVIPVPDNKKGEYWIIDCVLDRFNYEKTYTDKLDFTMETLGITIATLSGTEDTELNAILTGVDFELGGFGSDEDTLDLGQLKSHLVRTRNYIAKNPHSVIFNGGAKRHVRDLNYAIKHWDTPNRHKALNNLADAEHVWNQQLGLVPDGEPLEDIDFERQIDIDMADTLMDGALGRLGKTKSKKKFWNVVKTAAKKVTQKHKDAGKKIQQFVKKEDAKRKEQLKKLKEFKHKVDNKLFELKRKVDNKVIDAVKKTLRATLLKYNPLVAVARGGFLLVMHENWWGFARGLYPAYLTEAEALAKGYKSSDWEKAKKVIGKIEKIFVKVLAGESKNLQKAITHGFNRKPKLSGIDPEDETLGEPYSAGTAVTTASESVAAAGVAMDSAGIAAAGSGAAAGGGGFIAAIKKFFSKHKDKLKKVFTKENVDKAGTAGKGFFKKRKAKKAAKKAAKEGGGAEEGGGSSDSPSTESPSATPGDEANNQEKEGDKIIYTGPNGEQYDTKAKYEAAMKEQGIPADSENAATKEGDKIVYEDAEGTKYDTKEEYNAALEKKGVSPEEDIKKGGGAIPKEPVKKTETPSGSEEGFFTKLGNWAKENPGKATIAGVTTVAVLSYALIPPFRKSVNSLFTGDKSKASLSGHKRKKGHKTSRKHHSTAVSRSKQYKYKLLK